MQRTHCNVPRVVATNIFPQSRFLQRNISLLETRQRFSTRHCLEAFASTRRCNRRKLAVASAGRQVGFKGRQGNTERVVPEDDPRYRRVDMSEQHAYMARQALVSNVSKGEPAMNLAEAALQVAAEDDAIVTHSSVQLPLQPFMKRIQRMASDIAALRIRPLGQAAEPQRIVEAVEEQLFTHLGFKTPPPSARPDGRWAYLNQVLPSKVGIPATLAVIYAQVMQILLEQGAVQFAVRMDMSDPCSTPKGIVIPGLTRDMLLREDGGVLNSCTSEALVDMLRYLKEAYWPYAMMDTRQPHDFGGFRGAAMALLSGLEDDGERHAVAFMSSYRLERGIWTAAHLAGDIRRARAAAERLAMLVGDSCPTERRDLAVLLMHCDQWSQAAAELRAYRGSKHMGSTPVQDQVLVNQLSTMLRGKVPSLAVVPPLSCASVMNQAPPKEDLDKRLPLEW